MIVDLNKEAKRVHEANYKWWHDLHTGERLDRNKGELLMLVISEIAEAMEGERKNLKDTHLPHRPMAEVEMADALIRLLDYAGAFSVPIDTEAVYQVQDVVKNRGEALKYIVKQIIDLDEWEHNISEAIGCINDYCHAFGYDLEGAYEEKMAYNAVRADHKREARLAEGGKKVVKIYQRQIVGVYGLVSWVDINEDDYHSAKRFGDTVRILYDGNPNWNY